MGSYFLVTFLFLFGVLNLINTEVPKWVLGLVAIAAGLAILFSGGWKKTSALILAALAWSTCAFAADPTNAIPGLTPTGQVDVVNLINLAILALTPIIVQGFKKLIPKLPPFTLNLLAPVLGAAIGSLLHAVGVDAATGWGAAILGGLSTWLYELGKNVKEAVAPSEPKT